jgi:putative methionine-R-sulfoxide reductase with GAF domain
LFMHGSAQPEDRLEPSSSEEASAGAIGSAGDSSNGSRVFADTELESALQLLVERAQYITGATGTALALPQDDEMVCRASAGSSAPAVGARLQVRSGLTGESIARQQLLRCDNAEADPRVNLEACRALGIASIVVLPLLRKNGEVRGLFELFSDHPYAFEERDLIALERMAALTVTALDLAEQREKFAPAVVPRRDPEPTVHPSATPVLAGMVPAPPREAPAETSVTTDIPAISIDAHAALADSSTGTLANPDLARSPVPAELPVVPSPAEPATSAAPTPAVMTPPVVMPPTITPPVETPPESEPATIAPAAVPESMLRVQKCAACGFPVSDGRTLCLDCEKKNSENKGLEKKQREPERGPEKDKSQTGQLTAANARSEQAPDLAPAAGTEAEFIPAFLANAEPAKESWLADHVNLLAIVVLILGILVAVVVFR